MKRFYQDRTHAAAPGSVDIRKDLISHKNTGIQIRMHQFHGFQIILSGRLMRILHKFCLHRICKRLHPRKLVIGDQTVIKTDGPKPFKKLYCPFIRRCSMWYQCIIDIKNNPTDPFLI